MQKKFVSVLLALLMMAGVIAVSPITASAATAVIPMVAAGSLHALALKSDGTVWAWGGNYCGELGNGITTDSNTPVQVMVSPGVPLSGVVAIAAGYEYSLALKSDGTVWAWGLNKYGQLGDGTTTNRGSPVQVTGLSGVVAIAAGGGYSGHSLALKSDGTVWAWGRNNCGQLGDGTTTNRGSPIQVTGLSGVVAIAAGYEHSLALSSDGTVWAWGANGGGQLGNGTTTNSSYPVHVRRTTGEAQRGVIAIAAGAYHSLALAGGMPLAWGYNYYGQLGDNTTTNRSYCVEVLGLDGMSIIAAGDYHSLALYGTNSLEAWGRNGNGALGDGTTTDRKRYVDVKGAGGAGLFQGSTSVAGGNHFSVALKNDGTVWTWGRGDFGQGGNGTNNHSETPVQVKGTGNTGWLNLGTVYGLTLDMNGGGGGTETVFVTNGAAMPRITPPTRVGYTFEGYWDNTVGGKQYYTTTGTSANDWDKTVGAILYARWTLTTPVLYLSGSAWSAGAASSNTSVTVSSNISWSASSDAAAWLTVSPASGSNNRIITISTATNPGATSRSGTITVMGGGITRTFSVTQAGTTAALTVSPATWNPPIAGAGTNVTVTSNQAWTAISSDEAWLTVSPDSGTGNGSLAITAAANTGTAARSGTITVTGAGFNRTVTVNQAGAAASLTLSPTSLSPTAAAFATNVTVTSNVESWSTSSSAPAWLTASPDNGPGNGDITISAAENTNTASRSGTITVTGGGITRTVTVIQAGAAASLTVSPTTWNPPAIASNTSVTVTANVSWTASNDAAAWLTVTPASGSNNGSITINATANTGTASRSGAITITGGGITRTVTVTQAGTTPPPKKIFTTKYDSTFWNWLLFIVCFGFIWMWF